MKFILLSLFLSLPSFAQDYVCVAKANPNRGFPQTIEVTASPMELGGKISMLSNAKKVELGVISEAATVAKKDPAFELTIGLIGEADVSGLVDLSAVTSVSIAKAMTANGFEVILYQVFSGSKQIGGTFLVSGMGTACLPK